MNRPKRIDSNDRPLFSRTTDHRTRHFRVADEPIRPERNSPRDPIGTRAPRGSRKKEGRGSRGMRITPLASRAAGARRGMPAGKFRRRQVSGPRNRVKEPDAGQYRPIRLGGADFCTPGMRGDLIFNLNARRRVQDDTPPSALIYGPPERGSRAKHDL